MMQNSSKDTNVKNWLISCNKLFDTGQITNGSRPDYIDVYNGGERQYTNPVGEIKIEGATKIGIMRDLYRMALLRC